MDLTENILNTIQNAISKSIAKKPVWSHLEHGHLCPACGEKINEYDNKYCNECGQHIKWE